MNSNVQMKKQHASAPSAEQQRKPLISLEVRKFKQSSASNRNVSQQGDGDGSD